MLAALTAGCAGSASGGGEASPDRGPPFRESVEWAGLRYEVAVRASPPDRLRLRATVTNVSTGFREQELPFCLVRARLYREGRLVWDQAEDEGCGDDVRVVRLRGGESRTFSRTIGAERVLGDSLSPGRFDLRAHLPGATVPGRPRAETELHLGTVVLESPS